MLIIGLKKYMYIAAYIIVSLCFLTIIGLFVALVVVIRSGKNGRPYL